MQRSAESLHRATPIPSLEPLGSRRASGALSVSSIMEEDEEEHDSATSLPIDQVSYKAPGKVSKLSPIPSGKAFGARRNGGSEDSLSSRSLPGLKSLQRRLSGSGPPSPTVSDDSEGSGATFRSAESLHRPTPIPADAASSYAMLGSFSRRSAGRAQPTTPTINEFEDLPGVEGEAASRAPVFAAALPLDALGSTGSQSLHRATPIPGDLLSSTSSLGRSQPHRPVTPTIREDEGGTAESGSDLDNSEHYYGAKHPAEDGGSVYTTPRESQLEPLSQSAADATTASRLSKYTDEQAKLASSDLSPAARDILERAPTAVADTRLSPAIPAIPVNLDIDQPASAVTASVPASPSFSPFVESKDWERDILGVARFLRMCPGLSRQIIGDLLGENNERCLRVLECFTASFDFRGLTFEAALREYLESFRLPGEAQKIYRILDAWSRQFFKQCPGIFQTADAVHVLAFSLVLLNTDRHNSTVKRKMTCEEFVRNNKGVNAGTDFPTGFLEELFRNIERRAIRIPAAHPPDALPHSNSLPEPIKATQQRYSSPEKVRKGFLCF